MKNIILPEIVTVGIYNGSTAQKNKEITKKRNTTMFELELPCEAGGTSYINSESSPISDNIFICAKPGQTRHTRLPFKCYFVHMIVKEGALYDLLCEIPSYLYLEDSQAIKDIFIDMCKYYDTALENDKIMLQSLVLELIHHIVQINKKSSVNDRAKSNNDIMIEKALDYIENNLTGDLSLEAVAAYTSFSPIYFHNSFKHAVGKTLREYVEEQRIRRAVDLLISTEMTLAQIAYECGFSSQSYFSYAFKNKMKMTPREYAKEFYKKYNI